MSLSWIANTNQGRMVGDYMSTSFTGDGKAHPVFAWAKPPTGSVFAERMATRDLRPDCSAGLPDGACGQGAAGLSRQDAAAPPSNSIGALLDP